MLFIYQVCFSNFFFCFFNKQKKGEVTLTDKLKPITNTNQDSMNKLKTEIKIKEKIPKIPPKEATPTVPYRPKIVQKPKLTVAEVDRFDSYKMKPSAKVDSKHEILIFVFNLVLLNS